MENGKEELSAAASGPDRRSIACYFSPFDQISVEPQFHHGGWEIYLNPLRCVPVASETVFFL